MKLFLIIFIFFTFQLNADTFNINLQEKSSRPFYTYLEFFKDINGTYGERNLQELPQGKFFKLKRECQHLGMGFQVKTLWAHFNLINNSSIQQTKILWFKNITNENIFLFEKSTSGIKKIDNIKSINDFYFELNLEPNTKKEYYVKFKVNGPYIIDTKLMTIDESNILNYKSGLFFASFTTFMFIVIVLYFAFFIGFKQKMYLYFGLYSVSHLIFWLAMYGVYRPFDFSLIKVLTLASSSLFMALVSFDFLNMRKDMKRLYRTISGVLILLFGYYIFSYYLQLSVFQPMVFAIFYLITYLLILTAIIRAVINGHTGAIYYLFAILGYFVGYNITIGGVYASATIQANNFTMYIGMLGVIFDVIFASLAFIIVSKNIYKNQQDKLEEYSKSLESKVDNRTRKIKEQNILLRKLSATDTLTQLDNRLELDRILEEYYNSKENNIYLMMIDIDFFKRVNDNYGHLTGDSVLKQVAKILRKSLNEKDTIGRWGGEEFLIILKAKDKNEILAIADRIRKNIEIDIFDHNLKITISLGISHINSINSINEWIQKCDEALYQAKNTGRNKIVFQS